MAGEDLQLQSDPGHHALVARSADPLARRALFRTLPFDLGPAGFGPRRKVAGPPLEGGRTPVGYGARTALDRGASCSPGCGCPFCTILPVGCGTLEPLIGHETTKIVPK